MSENYDAIVLGAGAAGLMCAAIAGQAGKRVLVLEKAKAPGKKILISGGGRCNFTNIHAGPKNYLSANPHFAKSALARYTPQDFIDLVDRYGIAWHEKTLGQLFCDGPAMQIVEMLMAECSNGKVDVRCGEEITAVEVLLLGAQATRNLAGDNPGGRVAGAGGLDTPAEDKGFLVTTQNGTFAAPNLVIATGGPSIPKMGATGYAYDLARQFGLKIAEPRPALVPLTLGGEEVLFREISGVSANVAAKAGDSQFTEAALFTHRGLSGPAILQASSYWYPGEPVIINFAPEAEPDWLIAHKKSAPRVSLQTAMRAQLPARLADILAQKLSEKLGISGELANVADKTLRRAQAELSAWRFHPNGTEGFAKAEVTVGGIATDALSSKTMEARHVPGLYAIGEAVDVTGWLGGYNFQWAWASAHAAGEALAR
jgi:predicted flavoprotein YhiN